MNIDHPVLSSSLLFGRDGITFCAWSFSQHLYDRLLSLAGSQRFILDLPCIHHKFPLFPDARSTKKCCKWQAQQRVMESMMRLKLVIASVVLPRSILAELMTEVKVRFYLRQILSQGLRLLLLLLYGPVTKVSPRQKCYIINFKSLALYSSLFSPLPSLPPSFSFLFPLPPSFPSPFSSPPSLSPSLSFSFSLSSKKRL